MEQAVAYGKLFHLVKYSDVILVEHCEHRQGNVFGHFRTNFQDYPIKHLKWVP